MKYAKSLILLGCLVLILGGVSAADLESSCSTCVENSCDTRYRVDTFNGDGYSEFDMEDIFSQGETVYGKGWDGDWNLRLRYIYPNGSVAKTCAQNPGDTTYCDFDLPINAPLGTWKVELQYFNGVWIFWDCEPFTVVAPEVCTVTITNPEEDDWFDSQAVPINWTLSDACTPIDRFYIYYEKDGDCNLDLGHWLDVTPEAGVPSGAVDTAVPLSYYYLWDKPSTSGQYCLKIKVTSNGARGVSGQFNVDLAPPEVSLSVGSPQYGDCAEETEGDCYVNQSTPITLTCADDNPDEPWQSGVDYIEYSINGGDWVLYDGPFAFSEDSEHTLDYRCYDKVGKVDTESKDFIVESVAPEIEVTIDGPYIGDCPVAEEDNDYSEFDSVEQIMGCWIMDHVTTVSIEATDPEPHPVDDVTCQYAISVDMGGWSQWYDYSVPFVFTEDTIHQIWVQCQDALGNMNEAYETFYVDSTGPTTTLSFEGPWYSNGYSQWIDGVSTVILSAVDNPRIDSQELICATGVKETYYRYEQVADEWCYDIMPREPVAEGVIVLQNGDGWQPTSKETGDWMVYEGPFGMDESCHVIEYFSIDELGNEEDVQYGFVFVDKTAPLNNEVEPTSDAAHDCNGLWEQVSGECEEGWDWIVPLSTGVTLSCEDQEPHPSGVEKLCWKLTWDEEDITSNSCSGQMEGDYCCVYTSETNVYFYQECEHTLDFYCVDKVNKTSNITTTVIKVEGEEYTIPLLKKWNLISIPFPLISNNITEILFQVKDDVEIVWGYDDNGWHYYAPELSGGDLETMEAGYGYWVKAKEDTEFVIGGSLLRPGNELPPSRPVEKGWNLIGHYGTTEKPAYCSLFSLIDTSIGYPRWSALYGYDSSSDVFVPLDSWQYTFPGEGYWLEMDVEDYYNPATMCWGYY